MANKDTKVTDEAATEEIPKQEPEKEPKQEKKDEVAAPAVSEEPEQLEDEAEPVAAEAEEEGEEQAPLPMSRRKAKRLEKLEGLVDRLKGNETPQQKTEGIDYRQMIDAPDEVYQQLETKSQEYGQSQYNAGLEQAKSIQFHTRLEIDTPRVEAKYPQFDKESNEFDPALADSINRWFLTSVGYNSQTDTVTNANVRYSDFVEGIMELADNVAGVKTSRTRKNIAKQAASTGLRPDGSSAKSMDLSKAPQDMSNDELSAAMQRITRSLQK